MSGRQVDLHLHTTFSDGTERPERVVALARAAGLSAIAITDHDNLDALPIAQPPAAQAGIELILGIEMSSSSEGDEVHLLGFFLDPAHAGLREHLSRQHARRIERVREMVRGLNRVGLAINAEEVYALAGEGTVGRPHVARVLLKRGHVASVAEAFDCYLKEGGPGFVPGSTMSPAEIIRIIRSAGGIPVLAHPVFLKRQELIDELATDGLAGLEVYHSAHSPEQARRYAQTAKRLKLLATGGSDFHGDNKEGLPVGAVPVPYELVEALKAWKAQCSHS